MADAGRLSFRSVLENLVGSIGGLALAQYAGSAFWIPGGVALVAFLVFTKTPLRPAHFSGAAAFILGHVAWFAAAAAVNGTWAPVILDIVVLAAGLGWLWARPGFGPVLALVIFEVLALINNSFAIVTATFGSDEHKALIVHCVFRVAALAALTLGYRSLRAKLASPAGSMAPS